MNVEVVEQSAAGPDETVEPLDLPRQLVTVFGLASRKAGADRAMHAIGSHRDDVADGAVGNPFMQFLASMAVTNHETYGDLEIFVIRLLRQIEHAFGRDAVGDDWLLHEDVQATVDGVLEVQPAECERSGKDRDVAGAQAVHRFFVSVEADESLIFGDADRKSTRL